MIRGRFHSGWLLAAVAGLWLAACGPSQTTLSESSAGDWQPAVDGVAIHITSNGWHSEIVVPRALIPADAIPEAGDFPQARYLSFGWGDAVYFPAPDKTLGKTLRAALIPTASVVHLAGLTSHPQNVFPGNEIIELGISREGFDRLINHIHASFAREEDRHVIPGLYSFSRFYPAIGEFHLLNTCNTWTAEGLERAGLPVQIFGTVTAEELMAQIRQLTAP